MIVLESNDLELLVLPEVGGKIGWIRDKKRRLQFLVPPQKPYKTIPSGESWLDYDTSGMDDCFPNIASGPYPFEPCAGLPLPDLGEWTHETWMLERLTNSEVVLERSGERLPYVVQKRISFTSDRAINFSYRLRNTGAIPFRYLWSAHPLISTPGNFELILPCGNMRFRTFPFDEHLYAWPYFGSTDLSRAWIPEGTDLKVFVMGLAEGWCALRQVYGTVYLTFDLDTSPVLGLWFNNLGFPPAPGQPFRCIGVEPCTSPSDLLTDLPSAAYPLAEAQSVNEWSFGLEISV